MKKLFLILICLPIIGFSQHRVSIEDLTDSNGKMNTDGKVVPSNGPSVIGVKYLGDLFTGIAYVETDNNQLVSEFNYKNGYLHGFKIWYESGKLRLDGQCIDIEMNEWNLKSWYENGNQHRNSHNLLVIKGNKFEKGSKTILIFYLVLIESSFFLPQAWELKWMYIIQLIFRFLFLIY